ncbi:DsrE family protein [candidate division KSB1 bacterium]|nr:DsrE family protein [candidate division KSB1 bacterium]
MEKKNQFEPSSKLCVVWSSADVDVAKNVCFMYTLNAKKAGWFDVVHLVVWGPSAQLLADDASLQAEIKAMQESGVVTEACVACARRYGVDKDLKNLGITVKGMGKPLSDRLKADWKVITF